MKSLIFSLLLLLLGSAAYGDAPRKTALIREVLTATDLKGTLEKLRVANVAQTRNAILQQAGDKAGDPIMVRLINRAMEKYEVYSREIFDYTTKEKDYVVFYDEVFTEPELEGLVAFYKSDSGRALIRSQPILAAKMQQAAFQKADAQKARVDQIMSESIAEIQEELKKEGKS